jgi:tRNA G46 methylase TrmB
MSAANTSNPTTNTDDNKILLKIYNLVRKETDLFFDHHSDDRKSTVSMTNGEITMGSLEKVLDIITTSIDNQEYRLTGSSKGFIDIGSGFGKVVFHVAFATGISRCHGIEYVPVRHNKSKEVLRMIRNLDLAALPNVDLMQGDAADLESLDYSHVYMYDKVFSVDLFEKLAPLINKSPEVKVLVSF